MPSALLGAVIPHYKKALVLPKRHNVEDFCIELGKPFFCALVIASNSPQIRSVTQTLTVHTPMGYLCYSLDVHISEAVLLGAHRLVTSQSRLPFG